MSPRELDDFQLLEQTARTQGATAVFNRLIEKAGTEQNHRILFGALVMQARHHLGLPLIDAELRPKLEGEQRTSYENAFRDAARAAGQLCLTAGDIPSAWIYYRAIGEPEPVSEAIEKVAAEGPMDRIIEIAFQEGVNPRKGFELILSHYGICRAITWFGSIEDNGVRQHCLRMLVGNLYHELTSSLGHTISKREAAPEGGSVAALIAGRDWLFEGQSYYVDSTHLASILRFSPELEDEESRRMCLEMAEYGDRLDAVYHFRGDPPFEDIYRDYALYLGALLGRDADQAIAHFRGRATESGDPAAAEVVIHLLSKLGRYPEAIRVATESFPDESTMSPSCPSVLQLCQLAGDFETLRSVARQKEDVLAYAAGVLQGAVRSSRLG